MRNVDLTLALGPIGVENSFELTIRDAATGIRIADLRIGGDALGLMLCGNTQPATMIEHDEPSTPMVRETMTQSVEAPILPGDKASRDHVVSELLRPYEQFGWKGNRAHVGDKNRIERTLAGGIVLYRVDFERFVPERGAIRNHGHLG